MNDTIERWPLERLNAHPENATIFAPPETGETFATMLLSIKENGIWEPLLVKADGTILAGHMRYACAKQLGMTEVPVRVWNARSYRDEIMLLIRSNTDRRQLTKRELGLAYARLKQIPREEGGGMATRGRPKKGEGKGAASGTFSKTRDETARLLGAGRHEAAACATVFATPGVPAELQTAVNEGRVPPTKAAKAIAAETKRQGGELTSGEPLVALVNPRDWDTRSDHEKRIEAEVERFEADCERLEKVYEDMATVLTRRPLASLLGPTEHAEYRDAIHTIALRASLELQGGEMKQGATLAVIQGGKE